MPPNIKYPVHLPPQGGGDRHLESSSRLPPHAVPLATSKDVVLSDSEENKERKISESGGGYFHQDIEADSRDKTTDVDAVDVDVDREDQTVVVRKTIRKFSSVVRKRSNF